MSTRKFKLPFSVLVVVHQPDEPLELTAAREVREETGIDVAQGRLARWNVAHTFEIYTQWRHRFAPGVTHNTEHVFGLELAARLPVTLSGAEHTAFAWLPWHEAAGKCFSWSNRDAIRMLGERGVIT